MLKDFWHVLPSAKSVLLTWAGSLPAFSQGIFFVTFGVLYLNTGWLVSISHSFQKSLPGAPECIVCRVGKVAAKCQCRPQDIGNVRNTGRFLRRAVGIEWSGLKEATYAKGNRVARPGQLRPVENK